MFGFLNVYKPKGITSHDVVAQLRHATNIKQIGHTGTLDPFAEGVLPVCIGKATRLIEYLDDNKEYIATAQFGKTTDTYDLDGETVFESDIKVNKNQILSALKDFEGEILQTPPLYSALKVNGKKLYEYAREGKTIEIQPRKVTISHIELLSFNETEQSAQIIIACSKGTYIRSVANDLGKKLGCGGYLTKLIRTKAGKFEVSSSLKNYTENIEMNLINPLDVLPLPKLSVTEDEHKKIIQGQSFVNNSIKNNNDAIILVYNGEVSAIGIAHENIIKIKKVFS